MRTGITVELVSADRQRLAAIVADRNSPQKHVRRAQIVLLTADGCGTAEIMRRTGTSKTAVWRWQERFMTDGVAGLLRDKTRPPRVAPLGADVEQRVVARTLTDPPGERWSGEIGQSAKWISLLQCGLMAGERSKYHDETDTAKALTVIQGEGGIRGDQG